MPLRREERVGGVGEAPNMAPKRAPQRATAALGGGLGVVGKGAYMGGCMGASSMGGGHHGGAHLLGRRQRLQADRQVGRALPRSRGVRVHLPRKRARHAQQQNDVQVTRTLEHLSTLCWRCRMVNAWRMPRGGRVRATVWVRSGCGGARELSARAESWNQRRDLGLTLRRC
jgi:hypothetical protein